MHQIRFKKLQITEICILIFLKKKNEENKDFPNFSKTLLKKKSNILDL